MNHSVSAEALTVRWRNCVASFPSLLQNRRCVCCRRDRRAWRRRCEAASPCPLCREHGAVKWVTERRNEHTRPPHPLPGSSAFSEPLARPPAAMTLNRTVVLQPASQATPESVGEKPKGGVGGTRRDLGVPVTGFKVPGSVAPFLCGLSRAAWVSAFLFVKCK